MTYKDIFKSFQNDIIILEKRQNPDEKLQETLPLLKTKLSYYEKEMKEMEVLEKREESLIYYVTGDYQKSFADLRRRVIYRLNVLIKLASEIDRILSTLENKDYF